MTLREAIGGVHRDWHRLFDASTSRKHIVTTANGDDGDPGDPGLPDGNGGNGDTGQTSSGAFADGSPLTFPHNPSNPAWVVRADTGAGGDGGIGGRGGDGGFLVGQGGNGGNGGASGGTFALLASRTVFVPAGGAGASITVSASSGNAGSGGDGGDGGNAFGMGVPGGPGGNGGNGGASGTADAVLSTLTFTPEAPAHTTDDFSLTLSCIAQTGKGGNGGAAGLAGEGDFASSDGLSGDGGFANTATANASHLDIQLGGGADGTATLSILVSATGGRGGSGGDVETPTGGDGSAGAGGAALVTFADIDITGGDEDDVIQIALIAVGGRGGLDAAGNPGTAGGTSIDVHDVTIDGGGGINTLSLDWDGNTTTHDVSIDLQTHIFRVDFGEDNTVSGFRNATGGAGDDSLAGDSRKNVLKGGDGNDLFIGRGSADNIFGGTGEDGFAFLTTGESTSTRYDTIGDIDFRDDYFVVEPSVSAVQNEPLQADISSSTFDRDLKRELRHDLELGAATLLKVTEGSLTGHLFLVVNCNGSAGYQAGQDLVIDITGARGLNHLTVDSFHPL